MRQIATALAVCLALGAVAGCSAGAKSALPVRREFVTLGSQAMTTGVEPPVSGVEANSVPQGAFKGIPGATEIVVASGNHALTREQAIAKTRPADGRLVSAVDVVLPEKFLKAVLGSSEKTQSRAAWVVTWAGVTFYPTGALGAKPKIVLGGTQTNVIDATTGERIYEIQRAGTP